MASNLDGQLVVAISSRALFDLEEENRVFEQSDDRAYMKLQLDRLEMTAKPGVAFSLIKKLLAFNDAETQRVEVVILSRNDPVSGLRVFRSVQSHALSVARGVFTRGREPWRYLQPLQSNLFLSANPADVRAMARKARLPKAVRAFIPEHQGTMLIAYFYHQAQQQAEQQLNEQHLNSDGTVTSLNDADFRYDGPIPQSRETGIVMLADSCEAALRSLKDATPEEALAMINKILRARWQDRQLVQSGLTRSEMTEIATIFVRVWQQFNHQRIAYPKLAIAPQTLP